jgi:L-seryl-tRNA(Ser) seleniumtransferase
MYGSHSVVSTVIMTRELMLRSLPSIDFLLARPVASALSEQFSRDWIRSLLRDITEDLRREIQAPEWTNRFGDSDVDRSAELIREIENRLRLLVTGKLQPSLRHVINATGVIVHTNLGRAPLAQAAVDAVADLASGYSNLEYDLIEGVRGRRETHCQELLAQVAGSEAAVITNNNAAAVLLVLNSLAEGGEVIVSRGELIEIGGSFRIPDVMEKSRAHLREVGTTNRTRLSDYENAINDKTKLILRVHPSNYQIVGFTERPSVDQIAELSRRTGIPSFEDLGSGCLIDLSAFGIVDEPVVAQSIAAGISVVSFSGDKLLGGPQAGIIAGSRTIIDRVRKNPLMRALRVDKMTYAAVEATLSLYVQGAAKREIPVLRAITMSRDDLQARAECFRDSIATTTDGRIRCNLEEGSSVIGGGSAPGIQLPTILIAVESTELSATTIETKLRSNSTPIITRAEHDKVLIDLRTVSPEEEATIIEALSALTEVSPKSKASTDM